MEEFPAAPEEVLVLQERVSEAQRLATMVRSPFGCAFTSWPLLTSAFDVGSRSHPAAIRLGAT